MPCHHHSLSWNKIRGYFPVHHGSFFLRRFSCVESPRKIWSSIDPDGNGVPRRLECLGCILLQTGGTRKQWDELSIFALDIAIGGSVSACRFFFASKSQVDDLPQIDIRCHLLGWAQITNLSESQSPIISPFLVHRPHRSLDPNSS